MRNGKYSYLTASLAAVLSVSFIMAGGNAVNSVLAMMSAYFPEASNTTVRLVATLPSVMSMIVGLALGGVIGKKVRYKTTFVAGCLLFIIGGMGPAFLHENLALILVFRAIFGCAAGCFSFANAYYLSTLTEEFHARVLGLAAFLSNTGAAILQLVTGPLADRTWYYAFYPYAIGFVSLIMVLFLMKEDKPDYAETSDRKSESKEQLNPAIFKFIAINFFVSLTAMPVMSGMSTIVDGRGLGGGNVGTTVGIILTVCQVGGILVGVIFHSYVHLMKRFTLPVGLFIQGLGIFLILVAPNVIIVGLGATISGVGTILVNQLAAMYVGESTPKSTIPMATVLTLVIAQCAIFLSSYYIALCHRFLSSRFMLDVESSYAVSSALYVIAIVLTLIFNLNPKQTIAEGEVN